MHPHINHQESKTYYIYSHNSYSPHSYTYCHHTLLHTLLNANPTINFQDNASHISHYTNSNPKHNLHSYIHYSIIGMERHNANILMLMMHNIEKDINLCIYCYTSKKIHTYCKYQQNCMTHSYSHIHNIGKHIMCYYSIYLSYY